MKEKPQHTTEKLRAMNRKNPQLIRIRKHLEAGNSITPLQALNKFSCFRLGARIYDLKELGLKIKTEMVYDKVHGSKYAMYSLEK